MFISGCNYWLGYLLDIINVFGLVEFLIDMLDCYGLINKNDVICKLEKNCVRIIYMYMDC